MARASEELSRLLERRRRLNGELTAPLQESGRQRQRATVLLAAEGGVRQRKGRFERGEGDAPSDCSPSKPGHPVHGAELCAEDKENVQTNFVAASASRECSPAPAEGSLAPGGRGAPRGGSADALAAASAAAAGAAAAGGAAVAEDARAAGAVGSVPGAGACAQVPRSPQRAAPAAAALSPAAAHRGARPCAAVEFTDIGGQDCGTPGGQESRGSPGDEAEEREPIEPIEYFLLDYLGLVPEGLSQKLRESLDVHEDLVDRITARNEHLRARTRRTSGGSAKQEASSPAGSGSGSGGGRSPPVGGRTPLSAEKREREKEAWRRELRAQMAVKIAAVEETKLRVGAEAHYAAMKAKLQHTCKTARERIAAMAQRAELREREYRASSAAASAERERLQASLEAVKQQQAEARARIAGLEGDIHDLDRQNGAVSGGGGAAPWIASGGPVHPAQETADSPSGPHR
ncbi:unnamed protein product [Prorocentrum cordatum]|uniref:Centrosomal protein POC5 n=1 Tax=Prorocentrum cordatum TaxID=2364126 RepID=A0ABN9X3N7_9DINO|nr:unnamed protein product [Polarella glacialis]